MLFVWALGLASVATAFSNTSPFILISAKRPLQKSPLLNDIDFTISAIEDNVLVEAIKGCTYDAYVFVEQQGVSERSINAETMPFLSHVFDKAADVLTIPALGDGDDYSARAENFVRANCNVKDIDANAEGGFAHYTDTQARLVRYVFPDGGTTLSEQDEVLKNMLSHLVSPNWLLVLRQTKAPSSNNLERPTVVQPKSEHRPDGLGSSSLSAETSGSLFDNYQFFSPGIFMATTVSLLLAGILLTALSWLRSLFVSYKAFEKQGGPNKK